MCNIPYLILRVRHTRTLSDILHLPGYPNEDTHTIVSVRSDCTSKYIRTITNVYMLAFPSNRKGQIFSPTPPPPPEKHRTAKPALHIYCIEWLVRICCAYISTRIGTLCVCGVTADNTDMDGSTERKDSPPSVSLVLCGSARFTFPPQAPTLMLPPLTLPPQNAGTNPLIPKLFRRSIEFQPWRCPY